ncbi:MAG: adenosine deaminase, partial [Microthrixaceae bacterium]|nr:adenosine deaminase [Microthrixaceae bacterium]
MVSAVTPLSFAVSIGHGITRPGPGDMALTAGTGTPSKFDRDLLLRGARRLDPSRPSPEAVAAAPKVLLHDHLDGGARPSTLIELADEIGYGDLPSTDVDELAAWFHQGADRRDLALYLETFGHVVALMQRRSSIVRIARECAEDLATDGVVYAEVRMAPELCVEGGLSMDEATDAMLEGLAEGAAGTDLTVRLLCTAMRTAARSVDVARVALDHRDDGVVGFDIAGKEAGYPPTRHLDAFQQVMREDFHITIHAGEAFGLPSIAEALHYCGAERLGHGVRIVDDIELTGTEDRGPGREPAITESSDVTLGRTAAFVRDTRVPLEMCPSSNVHTGAAASIAEHPIGLLTDLRFRVTVNTDNRLMSNTTMSKEFGLLVDELGFDLGG